MSSLTSRVFHWLLRGLININLRYVGSQSSTFNKIGTISGIVLRHSGLRISDQSATAAALASEHYETAPLMAIKDVFRTWGISTKAAEVTFDGRNRDLSELSPPFITLTDNGEPTAVLDTKGDRVQIFNAVSGYHSISAETLFPRSTGVILLPESGSAIEEPSYSVTRRNEVWNQISSLIHIGVLLIIFSGLLVSYAYLSATEHYLFWFSMTLSTFAGLVTSAVMVSFYLGNVRMLQKACPIKKSWDCFSILMSKYSKIAGISYADIGIVYFSGLLLTLFMVDFMPLLLILIMSLYPLAITYFIYIQKMKLGRWCALCLLTHAFMMIQFIIMVIALFDHTLLAYDFQLAPSINDLSLLLALAGSALLWSFVRPQLHYQAAAGIAQSENQRMLFSTPYIRGNLLSEEKIEFSPLETDLLFTSDNQDCRELGYLLSSSCPLCGQILKSLIALIENPSDRLLTYRIRVLPTDEVDFRVVTTVTAIAKTGSPLYALKALAMWINDMRMNEIDTWLESLEPDFVEIAKKVDLDEFAMLFEWFEGLKQEITVPMVFFDGKALPQEYIGNEIILASVMSNRDCDLHSAHRNK